MSTETEPKKRDFGLCRDLTSYWILGLTNNYGYVVMLSAAHDIIGQFEEASGSISEEHPAATERYCHMLSTGAILLADILPSFVAKLFLPFIPLWQNYRIALAVSLSALGFILVAFAEAEWVAIMGVVVTSFSCGLGETTFLAYSNFFDKNVISTWSSGTGGAGIIGALSYACLRALDFSARASMLIMLISPIIESLAFWVLLRNPADVPQRIELKEFVEESPLGSFKERILYILKMLKYMIPLALVYFFEYFINMGMFELVYFEDAIIDQAAQYRWYSVDYQVGVFISRSSVNIIQIDKIWIMSVLQGLNVVYFMTEVTWFYTPSIFITLLIVFWEGLLGGGGYVNTFYKVSKDVEPNKREFAMSMVAQSDSFGIVAAGFVAIPAHNWFCAMPSRPRATW